MCADELLEDEAPRKIDRADEPEGLQLYCIGCALFPGAGTVFTIAESRKCTRACPRTAPFRPSVRKRHGIPTHPRDRNIHLLGIGLHLILEEADRHLLAQQH